MPEVFVSDEQSTVPIVVLRGSMLAEGVLDAEGVRGAAELSLLFVGVDAMTELNETFMDGRGPTDVLAFPIDADDPDLWRPPDPALQGPDRPEPDPGDAPLLLGDVVLCPEVAAANAPDHAGTLDDELALLVVHGILHVLGRDHATPDDAVAMRARELELLEALHWDGPAPAGFRQEQL